MILVFIIAMTCIMDRYVGDLLNVVTPVASLPVFIKIAKLYIIDRHVGVLLNAYQVWEISRCRRF